MSYIMTVLHIHFYSNKNEKWIKSMIKKNTAEILTRIVTWFPIGLPKRQYPTQPPPPKKTICIYSLVAVSFSIKL